MYRGTTPIFKIHINSKTTVALDNMKNIWLTIKSKLHEETIPMNKLVLNNEEQTIEVKLTQEQTLKFSSGDVEVQLRFIDENGNAMASNIKKTSFNRILKDGVIE